MIKKPLSVEQIKFSRLNIWFTEVECKMGSHGSDYSDDAQETSRNICSPWPGVSRVST